MFMMCRVTKFLIIPSFGNVEEVLDLKVSEIF